MGQLLITLLSRNGARVSRGPPSSLLRPCRRLWFFAFDVFSREPLPRTKEFKGKRVFSRARPRHIVIIRGTLSRCLPLGVCAHACVRTFCNNTYILAMNFFDHLRRDVSRGPLACPEQDNFVENRVTFVHRRNTSGKINRYVDIATMLRTLLFYLRLVPTKGRISR